MHVCCRVLSIHPPTVLEGPVKSAGLNAVSALTIPMGLQSQEHKALMTVEAVGQDELGPTATSAQQTPSHWVCAVMCSQILPPQTAQHRGLYILTVVCACLDQPNARGFILIGPHLPKVLLSETSVF